MHIASKPVKKHWFVKELPFHLMLLPAVIIVILFRYIPYLGISLAFENYNPLANFFHQEWVGLENFKYLFCIPDFVGVLRNTIFIAVFKIIGNIVVPVLIALLLNEIRQIGYKRTLQTLFYLPHFISWVALAGVLIDILSPSTGIVNQLIKAMGLHPVFFIGDPKVFPWTIITSDVWKEFGWGSIVYLAAIAGVDPTYYEAATIDGAGRFRQVVSVTLPSIAPIIMLMMVLSIGNIMSAGFDQIFNLYSPQVYSTGDIIDTYVYRIGIYQQQFSLATAVGLFKSIISFILIVWGYWVADRVAGYRVF